jgi:N-acyl homoserine lactone hydrolase
VGLGLTPEDISHVVLTHLHFDHTGYAKSFPHSKVSVQRREYDAYFAGDAKTAFFPEDLEPPSIRWNLVDGDWEVVPGLEMIDTRGHTAGHQSAVIELPNTGTVVLPADAGDLQENFDEEILPGASIDDEAALAAIRRINKIVADRKAKLILFHDPVAIQATKLAPAFYD